MAILISIALVILTNRAWSGRPNQNNKMNSCEKRTSGVTATPFYCMSLSEKSNMEERGGRVWQGWNTRHGQGTFPAGLRLWRSRGV